MQLFIAVIVLAFLGLFVLLSLPMDAEDYDALDTAQSTTSQAQSES